VAIDVQKIYAAIELKMMLKRIRTVQFSGADHPNSLLLFILNSQILGDFYLQPFSMLCEPLFIRLAEQYFFLVGFMR